MSSILASSGVKDDDRIIRFERAGGYDTTVPVSASNEAILAYDLDGNDLPRERGHPLRAVIPHLYGWKSAKWVESIDLLDEDELGFWEERGYNNEADPWREQHYWLAQRSRRSERLDD